MGQDKRCRTRRKNAVEGSATAISRKYPQVRSTPGLLAQSEHTEMVRPRCIEAQKEGFWAIGRCNLNANLRSLGCQFGINSLLIGGCSPAQTCKRGLSHRNLPTYHARFADPPGTKYEHYGHSSLSCKVMAIDQPTSWGVPTPEASEPGLPPQGSHSHES